MKKDRETTAGLLLRLRELGIMDQRLLSAFEAIPRQDFMPGIYIDAAYNRGSFPIECGQAMESVNHVAKVLHALEIFRSTRVLELGTGSGYQTALLACMGEKIISIERYRTLCERAKERLAYLNIENTRIVHADGCEGSSEQGHFDRIISNCSFDSIPKGFLDQLTPGGILIAPVGPPDDLQVLKKMTRTGSRFETEDLFRVRYQPFIKGIAQAI